MDNGGKEKNRVFLNFSGFFFCNVPFPVSESVVLKSSEKAARKQMGEARLTPFFSLLKKVPDLRECYFSISIN